MRDGVKVLASTLAVGGLAALFVFHAAEPVMPSDTIDGSWVAALGEAADRPARFGIDTAFTYGPASPLVTGYFNAAFFSRTLPLQLGFSLLFGWCTALLVAAGRRPGVAAAGTAACGLMVAAARATPDALFLGLPFLVFLAALRPASGRWAASAAPVGAVALGLTAMVKMSFPLAALPLLALADVAGLRRRVPRLVPLFALGVLGGAVLYGQRPGDLPAYAAAQGEVVAGYAAAMAIDGPGWDLWPFVALALGLVALAAAAGRRDGGRWTVPLGLGIALFFLFKAGFIRHDIHSVIAWTGLALVATVLAWARLGRRAALAVTGAACFVVLVYLPLMTVRQTVRQDRGAALARLYRGWLVGGPGAELAAWGRLLGDPAGRRAALLGAKASAWARIAAAEPLGPLPGTVDILPSGQTRLLAAGLAYRGRPSFQEYSTYTEGLLAANRSALEGPDAPRWMLFGPESPLGFMSLDGRFPGFAEGALWPDLLRLYRPDHRIGSLVALERRGAPAPSALGPARTVTAVFGGVTPTGGDGPVWAALDVRPNAAGRGLSALFRPPLLTLAVTLADGTERRFRLVPALAAAGFLLSPLVANASDYEALAAGRPAGADRRVTGVAVEGSRLARLFYAPEIGVTLRDMDASGPARPPAPDADAWAALLRAAQASGAGVAASPGAVSLPLAGLPAAGGLRRVALGYGVGTGGPAVPVCFAVRPADGTSGALWRGCAAPGSPPGRLDLDVPEGIGELALTATCGGATCDASWRAPDGGATASR